MYTKLHITKILFWISIIFSTLSFLLSINNKKEIYPFFYWKLYTQPLGSNLSVNDYRLYGIINNDTVRITNTGYPNLNQDDYYYFLSNEASKIKNKQKDSTYYKIRLQDFGKFIAPKYDSYLLVEENFNPIDFYKNNSSYYKKIIFSTQ